MSLRLSDARPSLLTQFSPMVHRQEKLLLCIRVLLLQLPAFASAQMESFCSPDVGTRPYGAGMWLRGNLNSGMRGIPTS